MRVKAHDQYPLTAVRLTGLCFPLPKAYNSDCRQVAYFAVLDGHAGRRAAEFAAGRLHEEAMRAGLVPPEVAKGDRSVDPAAIKAVS